jgi:hypothetical protein
MTATPTTPPRANYWETALYDLLSTRFPELHDKRGGRLSVAKLAAAVGRRSQTIYTMLRTERVSSENAKALIEYANKAKPKAPAIHDTDLLPYLLK